MSGSFSEMPSPSNAKAVTARAADWLQRRDFWDWTDADQVALDAWLAESWAHRVAYYRLEAAWSRTNRLAALRGHRRDGAEVGASEKAGRFLLRAVRACAVVALIGAAYALYVWQPQAKTYSTGIGERETLALSDGSQIELNTNTSLRILANGLQRQVWLDKGEAYFEITHDPMRPFTVWTSNRRVTDIGTKFDVRQDPNRLELAVVEGEVGVSAASGPQSDQSLRLSSGDLLVATAHVMSVVKASPQAMSAGISWRRGMLVFEDVPLAKVVEEFNRYGTEKLVVADEAAARTHVSATFPINGVEDFVQLAHRVLGLHVEHHDGEIIISHARQ